MEVPCENKTFKIMSHAMWCEQVMAVTSNKLLIITFKSTGFHGVEEESWFADLCYEQTGFQRACLSVWSLTLVFRIWESWDPHSKRWRNANPLLLTGVWHLFQYSNSKFHWVQKCQTSTFSTPQNTKKISFWKWRTSASKTPQLARRHEWC